MPPRIVVVDGYALNPGDLSWGPLQALGEVTVYDRTAPDQVVGRAIEAEAVLTNKVPFRTECLAQLPRLRYLGVLATGYDIVDVAEARRRGIAVTNIPAYGTRSVAQHTFALLLELCHQAGRHSEHTRAGGWTASPDWSYHLTPLVELAGKTLGIVGYGRIGQQVGEIARAFGMKVIAHDPAATGPESVDLDTLLSASDVVSLHAPLTVDNRGLINAAALSRMKPGAFLINTARGLLVNEGDLAAALRAGRLAGAALDVLSQEPPPAGHPLLSAPNCLVTPHMAWATTESRARLLGIAADNLSAFLSGRRQNLVF
jgi:glycerate dehydrogenase